MKMISKVYGLIFAGTLSALPLSASSAQTWGDIATSAALIADSVCTTDGTDIICDGNVMSFNGATSVAISGSIILGDGSETCDSTTEGAVRYESTSKVLEVCDGTNWSGIATSSGGGAIGIDDLADAVSNSSVESVIVGANATGTGAGNTGFGFKTLGALTTGLENTAFGKGVMENVTAGRSNTAVGHQALLDLSTGDFNTAVGKGALANIDDDTRNTALGYQALNNLTAGDNNVAIGFTAANSQTSGSYNIAIGYNVELPNLTGSNQLNIGNTIYGDLSNKRVQIGTTSNSDGSLIIGSGVDSYVGGLNIRSEDDVHGLLLWTGNDYVRHINAGYAGTDVLSLNQGGGYVGIGTTAPSSLLHMSSSGDAVLTLEADINNSNELNNPGILMIQDGGQIKGGLSFVGAPNVIASGTVNNDLVMYTSPVTATADLKLATAGVVRFTVRHDGAVGISDTTPDGTLLLDVEGQIGATEYCDENGLSCLTVSDISNSIGLWADNSTYIARSGMAVVNSAENLPAGLEGAGVRSVWYPNKGAFRAGEVTSTQWDDVNIGNRSVAFGYDNIARGVNSFVAGSNGLADAGSAIVLGAGGTATGYASVAMGRSVRSNGDQAIALGNLITVDGDNSFGIGLDDTSRTVVSANTMAIVGGQVVISDTTASGTLALDVEGQIGATEYCDENGANCTTAADIASALVDSSADWYALTNIPTGVENISNTALDTFELTQLQNIDATTITTTQFGYLGAMDQSVSTTSDVTFANITGANATLSGTVFASGDISTAADLNVDGRADVGADVSVTGTVQAAAFVGDGSALTGVVASSVTIGIDDLTDAKHDTDDYSSLFLGNGAGANDDGTDNKNLAIGYQAMVANTTGFQNLSVGYQSMASSTVGEYNTAVGNTALQQNTTGSQNTGVGFGALSGNAGGNANTGVGYLSMANATGSYNTALGYASLRIATGAYNTAVGEFSMGNNTAGQYNSGLGGGSLYSNSNGNGNAVVGYQALGYNTSGSYNVSLGYRAQTLINMFQQPGGGTSTGSYNVSLGAHSNELLTTGSYNIAIGTSASVANPTGSYQLNIGNTIYGDLANDRIAIGDSTFSGTLALDVSGSIGATEYCDENGANCSTAADIASALVDNSADWYALTNIPTGVSAISDTALDTAELTQLQNIDATTITTTQFGYLGAMDQSVSTTSDVTFANITGANATLSGTVFASGDISTAADLNVDGRADVGADVSVTGTVQAAAFVGDGASITNISASALSIGIDDLTDAIHDSDDYSSLFLGNGAGANDDGTSNSNIGIGKSALSNNSSGAYNVAIGVGSLNSNTIGQYNIATGFNALLDNVSGNNNIATGFGSLADNTTGSGSVAIGTSALRYNTTGRSNLALGDIAQQGVNGNSTGSYNVSLGYKANQFLTTGDNNIAIGASVSVADPAGNDQLNIGNTIYGDLASGRIGIGTTTPMAALDVSVSNDGDVALRLGIDRAWEFMQSGDDSSARLVLKPSVDDKSFDISAENGVTDYMIIHARNDGNGSVKFPQGSVKIGDSMGLSAGLMLDVEGSVGATEYCDENGLSCLTVSDISNSIGLWADNSTYIARSGMAVVNSAENLPAGLEGAGVRSVWYPNKGAFRAGEVTSTQWDDVNIGVNSLAVGYNVQSDGAYAASLGYGNTASGASAFAAGRNNTASGLRSVALGYNNTASGASSFAIGEGVTASANRAIAMGDGIIVSGINSFGIGLDNTSRTVVSANTMAIVGGQVVISDTTASGTLALDVEGSVGAIEYCDENGANCSTAADIASALVDNSADWYSLTNIPTGVSAISDTALDTAELTQLQNIDATTITTTQFGYLGAMDQSVSTTSDVAFNSLTAAANVYASGDISTASDLNIDGRADVGTDVSVTGTVQAAAFVGDGSSITNISAAALSIGIDDLSDGGSTAVSSTLFLGENAGANNTASNNTAVGVNSFVANTSGNANAVLGSGAMSDNITGSGNTAIGQGVLALNTSGSYNTALGQGALSSNVTNNANVAIGRYALNVADSYGNSSVGSQSMRYTTTGSGNVALGLSSMLNNTSGSNNVAIGGLALGGNGVSYAASSGNVAVGYSSGFNITTGMSDNIFLGKSAGYNQSNGSTNIAIGSNVDLPNLTGNNQLNIGNTIYGDLANDRIAIGDSTFSGTLALDVSGSIGATEYCDENGANCTTAADIAAVAGGGSIGIDDLTDAKHDTDDYSSLFLGNGAGANDDGTDNQNVGVGKNALNANTAGGSNAAFGYGALRSNTAGSSNAAFGHSSLSANTTGYSNAAFGRESLQANTTGNANAAFGANSLQGNTTGIYNAAFGRESLKANTTGSYNAAFGANSLQGNTTGDNNAAFGHRSLAANTTGNANAAFGWESLKANTTGNYNAAFGHQSLYFNTTGHSNLAFGNQAQYGVSGTSTGSYNVSLGHEANELLTTGNNNIAIGASVSVADPAGNDQLNIGDTIYGDLANKRIQIGTTSNSAGSLIVGSSLNNVNGGLTVMSEADSGALMLWVGNDGIRHIDAASAGTAVLGINQGGGYVGIGTAAPSAALEVSGSAIVSGEVSATAFNATSDRTLKENIETIDGALDKVSKLRGVEFDFKQGTGRALPTSHQIGVIAQEVKEVFPEVVKGEEGGMAVNYAALVGPLIEAVKELKVKVEAQDAEIESLKKQLMEKE